MCVSTIHPGACSRVMGASYPLPPLDYFCHMKYIIYIRVKSSYYHPTLSKKTSMSLHTHTIIVMLMSALLIHHSIPLSIRPSIYKSIYTSVQQPPIHPDIHPSIFTSGHPSNMYQQPWYVIRRAIETYYYHYDTMWSYILIRVCSLCTCAAMIRRFTGF